MEIDSTGLLSVKNLIWLRVIVRLELFTNYLCFTTAQAVSSGTFIAVLMASPMGSITIIIPMPTSGGSTVGKYLC